MGIGMSGMISGLDTDTIVQALVSGYSQKKTDYEKAQTKVEWKLDAWKSLNTKVYSFYSKSLSNLRFQSNYTKKTTSISDTSIAKITASGQSVNGTQSLAVAQLAKSGYLTGARVEAQDEEGNAKKLTASSTLSELGIEDGSSIVIGSAGKETTIAVDGDTTVRDLVAKMKQAGVQASFDEANQRFFVSSAESGKENDFTITAGNANGTDALSKLGLTTSTISYAEYKSYEAWANYSADELTALIAKEIDSRYNSQKTTADKEKAALETEITSLKNKNTSITQAQFLSELKAAMEADADLDADEWISNYKETLSEDELSAVKSLEANIKTDGEVDADKVASNLTKINEALGNKDGFTGLEYATMKADNAAAIQDKQNTIANANGELDALVDSKNADLRTSLETSVKAEFEARQANAKDVIVNYEVDEATQTVKALNADGTTDDGTGSVRIYGQDAIIYLNGAKFESNENTITVNGLSITATETTGKNDDGSYKTVSITTTDDTDAIYDMVRDFFSEYNELINEMDKLYNADSAKGYEPLTDDEKEAMSEDEVEKWETKIKDSLLKGDDTLASVSDALKNVMMRGFTVDGKTMRLSDFGIGTQSYFTAPENEKNAIHIDGDEEDEATSGKTDKLKSAILTDSDTVVEFFTKLSSELYSTLTTKMQATTLSSSYTLYNDKQMKSEYSQYTDRIADQEDKVAYWEQYYYDQFTAMETALSRLNSQTSALSGLLGS